MASAYQGAGIAAGAANVQDYVLQKPERDARRAEALARQKEAEMGLQEYQQNAPLRAAQSDLALQQAQEELRKLQAGSLQDKTFTAFSRYNADNDTRHINNFLQEAKRNPLGNRLYSDWSRWDSVPRTPETEAMLANAGVKDIDGYFDSGEKTRNFVLATKTDGSQQLLDLDKIYAMSGFTKHMQASELESFKNRQLKKQLEDAGVPYSELTQTERLARAVAKEQGIPLHEAVKLVTERGSKAAGSMLERAASRIMQENPGTNWQDAMRQAVELTRTAQGSELERETKRVMEENPELPREQAMAQAKKNLETATSKQKDLSAADEARNQIDELAGGDFFAADMNDPMLRRKIGRKITELEALTGSSMTTEDRRLAREVRELTALGATAGSELTPEATGLLDNLLGTVKTYVSDNVDNVAARSSYETFRNTLRNALYGATLTEAEIQAFNAAVGTLGKQAGPVLGQLRTQMTQLKSRLQSIYDFNDEYIAQYYLGTGLEDLDKAIAEMDRRIGLISGSTAATPTITPETAPKLQGERQSMDEIFSGMDL